MSHVSSFSKKKKIEEQYLSEVREGKQNPVTQFSYAVYLSRSKKNQQKSMAKLLLMQLLDKEKGSREVIENKQMNDLKSIYIISQSFAINWENTQKHENTPLHYWSRNQTIVKV